MLGAGRLDRRVTVRRYTTTTNALNEEIKSWSDYVTFWAGREDVRDAERRQGGDFGAFLESRFVLRWNTLSSTITPKDRLNHDGSDWEIVGVKELQRRRWIEITARREGD